MKTIQLLMMNKKLAAGWDLSTASYDSVYFYVGGQNTNPYGLSFKPDGTKMYVMGSNVGRVYQYSLPTAWDISTASYDSVYFSVSGEDGNPYGLSFKPDGTKMYVVGNGNQRLHQYSLSTAWEISTASYDSKSFNVRSYDSGPTNLFFKPDGTKMYMAGSGNQRVYQYSLPTAWDISTASYGGVNFSVSSQDSSPFGPFFKPDGTKMYVLGRSSQTVYQYSLSTAWEISTASYDSVCGSFN